MESGPYVFNCNSSRVAINNLANLKSSTMLKTKKEEKKVTIHKICFFLLNIFTLHIRLTSKKYNRRKRSNLTTKRLKDFWEDITFSRPGQTQRLLYKKLSLLNNSLIKSLSAPLPSLPLWPRQAQTVRDNTTSDKADYIAQL